MKRFHVHVAVQDLEQSIRFYSSLFATGPTVRKPDYAKWMLDDPRVNFAISERGSSVGIDHLGIQVDDADELGNVHEQLEAAGAVVFDEGQTTCCYAKSEKFWIHDPQGVAWETFRALGESTVYGGGSLVGAETDRQPKRTEIAAPCCGPTVKSTRP